MRALTRFEVSLIAVTLVLGSAAPLAAQEPNRFGGEAAVIAHVLDEFKTHAIVALGLDHRLSAEANLAETIVLSPGFAGTVNDVVIECANARYQPILDRYIAGAAVSPNEVAIVWRNATQVGRCDGPDGAALLAAIRQHNLGLPRARRIRVIAADPKIDWDAGSIYVIVPHQAFGRRTAELEARMRDWARPTLVEMSRAWPGDEAAGTVYTGAVLRVGEDPCKPRDPYPGRRLRDLADAFLYLGPMSSMDFTSPPVYGPGDSAYLR